MAVLCLNDVRGKGFSTKIVASMVTLLVIALLVISGPAQALNAVIGELSSSSPNKGESISTVASIEVNSGEKIELDKLYIVINGPTGRNCMFTISGNLISGCEGISIQPLSILLGPVCNSKNIWCEGADFNKDGYISQTDYGFLDSALSSKQNCTSTSRCNGADMNNDGIINLNDYFLVDSAFYKYEMNMINYGYGYNERWERLGYNVTINTSTFSAGSYTLGLSTLLKNNLYKSEPKAFIVNGNGSVASSYEQESNNKVKRSGSKRLSDYGSVVTQPPIKLTYPGENRKIVLNSISEKRISNGISMPAIEIKDYNGLIIPALFAGLILVEIVIIIFARRYRYRMRRKKRLLN